MFDIMNSLTASGLAWVTTIANGPLWTVLFTILWVVFLIIVLGLIYAVVNAIKRFQGGNKRGR